MPPWRAGAAGAGRPASAPTRPLAIAEVKTPAAPAPARPTAAFTPPRAEAPAPETPADHPAPPPPPAPAGPDPAEHPLVKEVIELFNARIVDVQPKRD